MDEARLHEFLGKMVGNLGAAASAAMVLTGARLGLYKTPRDRAELSDRDVVEG